MFGKDVVFRKARSLSRSRTQTLQMATRERINHRTTLKSSLLDAAIRGRGATIQVRRAVTRRLNLLALPL